MRTKLEWMTRIRTRVGMNSLAVVDNFTRECLAIEAGQSLTGQDVAQTLTRITAERGASNPASTHSCFAVLTRQRMRGSHHEEVQHRNRPNSNNILLQGQEVAVDVKEEEAAHVELLPGQFSLHHSLMVHGPGSDNASERRIGVAIRYLKTSAKQLVEATDSPTLVRGEDCYENFQHEPTPEAIMHPAAVKYLDDLLSVRYGGRYRQKSRRGEH